MKFVVDAQLPRRIAYMLRDHGQDAVHTLDLPDENRTTDSAILDLADREQRVVVTKDADFVNSFHLARRPRKLLLISTGNINNTQLAGLLLPNLDGIVAALSTADFVELTRTSLITHA
jgi:predicted nuclease of predicted toxin-antitoxin system